MKWIENLKPQLCNFVTSMQADEFSYVKYSLTGDLYNNGDDWGLANTVYAVKTMYISGMLDELDESQKNNLYKSITAFSQGDGYITDCVITKPRLVNIFKSFASPARRKAYKNSAENTRRGETKQAFAALENLGRTPQQPFNNIPTSPDDVIQYLDTYNWSTPWHSCAHFAILMFFLYHNDKFFGKSDNAALIQSAVKYMNSMQSADDGCWYKGKNVPLYEKVNGAMKYLTGIHAANIYEFPYPEKLVDTALSATNDEHACNNFNVTYCLYAAHKIIPDYRKNEIEEFLLSRLEIYKEFYYPDYGGFSFKKGAANDNLYGAKITKGLNEPDIHGTCLFMFGIALIDEVLGLELGLKIPVS